MLRLLRLFVNRVLVAPLAIFLVLHPPRLFLLVLRRGVIPALAVSTLKRDDISHA